jgi:hypothetical protein
MCEIDKDLQRQSRKLSLIGSIKFECSFFAVTPIEELRQTNSCYKKHDIRSSKKVCKVEVT